VAPVLFGVRRRRWCRGAQKVAPHKYPRAIEFLPLLPRTNTGELQRFKLRELA